MSYNAFKTLERKCKYPPCLSRPLCGNWEREAPHSSLTLGGISLLMLAKCDVKERFGFFFYLWSLRSFTVESKLRLSAGWSGAVRSLPLLVEQPASGRRWQGRNRLHISLCWPHWWVWSSWNRRRWRFQDLIKGPTSCLWMNHIHYHKVQSWHLQMDVFLRAVGPWRGVQKAVE